MANSHQHNEVAKWANGARVPQPRYFWFRFWQIHMQSHPTHFAQLALPTFMKPESVQIIDTGMNRRTELLSQAVKSLAAVHGKGELRAAEGRNREEQCEGNANINKS